MIKKLLIIFAILFIGYQAQSQVLISIIFGDKLNSPNLEFGLVGGYNWSKISGFQTGKPLGTFNLGFYFDFRIKPTFFIYTGVLVKSNTGIDNLRNDDLARIGATIYDTSSLAIDGNYKQKLSYFWVPILAKYRHKSNVFIEAGPQVGLMYKARIEFDSKTDDKEALLTEINKDDINRIDIGVLVGAGYKFKKGPGWSISVKYYYGFVDVYKNVPNTKNSSLFLTANIPIGADKKKKQEKEE